MHSENGGKMDRDAGTETALDRAMQHQAAGRFTEAAELLDRLVEDSGGERDADPILVHHKGLNLVQLGKIQEGRALIDKALARSPSNPIQLTDCGVLFAQSGDIDKAIDYFQQAIEVAPNYATALANLGAAQIVKTDFEEAITALTEAIRLDPSSPDTHTNLAVALIQTGNFDNAIEVLFKVLSINPQSLPAHIQLSGALFRRDRFEAAEHHARRAIELNPDAAEAYLHLGNALASSGKLNDAVETLLKVADRPPVGIQALGRLIHLRKTLPDSPELRILEGYMERSEKLGTEPSADLHYSAGKAFDDLAEYDRAFEHFQRANKAIASMHPFNLEDFCSQTQRVIDLCSPEVLRDCAGGGVSDISPIFICGMPRSGTTLMEQMFSRHPKVQAGGELLAGPTALQKSKHLLAALNETLEGRDISADDFTRVGEDYIAALHREGLHSEYVSDKMPANYRNIGLLSLALPRAKFLIMRRHPMDCLLSNYFQNFGRNQAFSTDFKNLAGVYTSFDSTVRIWKERLPGRVREVSYEAITEDTEAQLRNIISFVGLEWHPDVLDHTSSSRQVNTASIAQVRQPVNRRAVDRWQRYSKHLTPLATELRPFLTKDELKACNVAA